MRASGILMPVFSLPGPFGIGTLGKEAFAFVDFLADAKQTYWQILPIGPTGYGDSPYQSFSAFAGNPYFIDYRLLADVGLLTADEVPAARPVGPIDYGALYNERPVILKKAADRLLAAPSPSYEAFCEAQSFWLEDYALFMAVKAEQGQAGLADWPDDLRCRKPEAIAAAKQRLAGAVDYYKAVQFFFYTQWNALKAYANGKGVRLVGDIPIYVSPDSSDLWTHPELFQTDGEMHLTQVAGCPPDAFAADGQLWGNPLYDWPTHKATGFAWWKQRMKHATSIYDVVRIDHFRGFDTYYAIPYGNKTADQIFELSCHMLQFLGSNGVKCTAVACNTISTMAERLRPCFDFRIISIVEEAAKYVIREKLSSVGLIGTEFTVASGKYAELIHQGNPDCHVVGKGSPLLAALVDRGDFNQHDINLEITTQVDNILSREKVSDLILGCTHYPIVEENFHECYPQLHLINPALEQANAVKAYLAEQNALNPQKKPDSQTAVE